MKIIIKCGLLVILLLGSSTMVYAGNGIKRSEWSFGPELSSGNLVYGEAAAFGFELLRHELFGDDRPWWYPTAGIRSVIATSATLSKTYWVNDEGTTRGYFVDGIPGKTKIEGRSGHKVKDQLFDFSSPSYSIGYSATFMSKEVPFGFLAKIAYEQQGFDVKMNNENNYTKFRKQMIVPELLLKVRIGKYRTAEDMPIINIGASYDYAIDAKGFYSGKETVNSGFSGILGFSWGMPEYHFQVGADYSFRFYDYFNKDYPGQSEASANPSVMSFFFRLGF